MILDNKTKKYFIDIIESNVYIKTSRLESAERHFYFLGLFDLEILKANKAQL